MSVAEQKSVRLLDLEQRLEDEATASMRRVLVQLFAQLEALWPGDDASPLEKRKALSKIKISRLDKASQQVGALLLDGMYDALKAGWSAGLSESVSAGVAVEKTLNVTVPKRLIDISRTIEGKISERVIAGTVALRTAKTKQEAKAAIALAGQSITAVRQASTYVVNGAANVALDRVAATDSTLITVWHPERDACVRCLNRAGEIDPDEIPPEHPFCRCTLWVLERESGARVADGLRREAERSILRGWSRPSESEAVRIEAARKLLAKGTDLPKSVQAYARRAIKAGEFPRGRKFPG